MVKQEALMESLSSNLKGFLNQIQGNLSVPDKKFLRDGFIGLVRAGHPIVCQMAREVPNQGPKYTTKVKRLDLHLTAESDFGVCFTFVGRFIRYSLWWIFQAAKGFAVHNCSHLPLSQASRNANTDDDPKRLHIIPDCFNRLPTTLLHAPSAAQEQKKLNKSIFCT